MGYLTDICEGPLSFTLILRAPSRESNPVNKSFPVKSNPVKKSFPVKSNPVNKSFPVKSNPVNKSFPVKSNPVNKVIPSQNADTTCENQKCPHPLNGPSTRTQNS